MWEEDLENLTPTGILKASKAGENFDQLNDFEWMDDTKERIKG